MAVSIGSASDGNLLLWRFRVFQQNRPKAVVRAPMTLDKMSYDSQTGTVIYCSNMFLGLERNSRVMPGAAKRLISGTQRGIITAG
jgi:hypothetical protein